MRRSMRSLGLGGLVLLVTLLVLVWLDSPGKSTQSISAAPRSAPYTTYFPIIHRNYRYVGSTVFGVGMDNGTVTGGIDQVAQAGTTWVRFDTPLLWAQVEPTETLRMWDTQAWLEMQLQNASSRGLKVVLVVRQTPSWAQLISGYSCGPIRNDANFQGFQKFANFIHDAVVRYSVPPFNVKYWEIWNEPDIDYRLVSSGNDYGCWGNQDDPTGYYGGGYFGSMLGYVYPQIKAVDPQAQVLVGGLLLDCDPNNPPAGKSCTPSKFLEGILASSGGAYFDGVSFHAYDYYASALGKFGNLNWASAWSTTGPVVNAKSIYLKNLLNKYNVTGKFLMNTESAVVCDACTNDPTYETTKAYYLAQGYASGIAQGLMSNDWYSVLGWRNSGLLNADLSPRPAFLAYQFARTELLDSTNEGKITALDVGTSGVAGYKFNRVDRHVWVVWSLDGATHTMALPGVPFAAWDVFGNPLSATSSMSVDLKPIYLEW